MELVIFLTSNVYYLASPLGWCNNFLSYLKKTFVMLVKADKDNEIEVKEMGNFSQLWTLTWKGVKGRNIFF